MITCDKHMTPGTKTLFTDDSHEVCCPEKLAEIINILLNIFEKLVWVKSVTLLLNMGCDKYEIAK